MKETDAYIMEKIQQEQIRVPDSYLNKVNMTLQNLPEKDSINIRKLNKIKLRYAVAIAASLILLVSGTAYATVNYIQQRMLSMSGNEKKEITDYTQKSMKDADTYSRELTETEKERMQVLLDEYQNQGRFPENGLAVVDNNEMVQADTLAFASEDSMFVLPERTLTDEELLQIIDFYYKRDYSLMTSKEDIPSTLAITDDAIEEYAVEQAKAIISKIYQVDFDNFEVSVEADVNEVYRIEINNSEEMVYSALYDLSTERIVEIGYSANSDEMLEAVQPDNDYFVQIGEGLTDIIYEMDNSVTIKESCCLYTINEDGMLIRGTVSYIFKLENGECYVVKYNLATDNITDLFIVPYSYYQQILDDNADKLAKKGMQQIEVSFP